MGYLIPLLIFAAVGLVIYLFTKPKIGDPALVETRRATLRRWAFIGLGVVVLVWLLSALGVFGTAPLSGPRDPMLNR